VAQKSKPQIFIHIVTKYLLIFKIFSLTHSDILTQCGQ